MITPRNGPGNSSSDCEDPVGPKMPARWARAGGETSTAHPSDRVGLEERAQQRARPGTGLEDRKRISDSFMLGGHEGRQGATEQRADLGAGQEIARLLRAEDLTGEEPTRAVEGQLHEPFEGNRTGGGDLLVNGL